MKVFPRVLKRIDSGYRRWLALLFRLTGRRIFIAAYCRRRNLLLSIDELYSVGVRLRTSPGDFLVFGAGNDSILWATLNRAHLTVFLESDADWLTQVREQWEALILYPVTYSCRLADIRLPEQLGEAPAPLDLPKAVRSKRWATILVDAPQGWGDGPGRAQSIYEASRLIAPGGRIFVHDCDREGERCLVGRYLRQFVCTPLTARLWSFEC